jgi:hypothetical protein
MCGLQMCGFLNTLSDFNTFSMCGCANVQMCGCANFEKEYLLENQRLIMNALDILVILMV